MSGYCSDSDTFDALQEDIDKLRAALIYARRFMKKDDFDIEYIDTVLKETE